MSTHFGWLTPAISCEVGLNEEGAPAVNASCAPSYKRPGFVCWIPSFDAALRGRTDPPAQDQGHSGTSQLAAAPLG
jgi:hypothetical protein